MRVLRLLPAVALLPFAMGARGDGCAANSRSPAPDVTGTWDVTYDDVIGVEVKIGGAVYTGEVPATGGVLTIDHEGNPITFDLDCARPAVVCPSEAWPTQVYAEQRNEQYEHRMIVTLPTQSCNGTMRAPAPSECGAGTLNPDCTQVCDGEVVVREEERFGVIGESGDSFRLYLGAGIATNGINCALLAWSVADAGIASTGRGSDDWQATAMEDGLVTIGYAGGCLWAGQTDPDPALEALVIGASVTFTTGFTATRSAF